MDKSHRSYNKILDGNLSLIPKLSDLEEPADIRIPKGEIPLTGVYIFDGDDKKYVDKSLSFKDFLLTPGILDDISKKKVIVKNMEYVNLDCSDVIIPIVYIHNCKRIVISGTPKINFLVLSAPEIELQNCHGISTLAVLRTGKLSIYRNCKLPNTLLEVENLTITYPFLFSKATKVFGTIDSISLILPSQVEAKLTKKKYTERVKEHLTLLQELFQFNIGIKKIPLTNIENFIPETFLNIYKNYKGVSERLASEIKRFRMFKPIPKIVSITTDICNPSKYHLY